MIDIAKVNSFILFNNWRAQNPDVEILKRSRRFTQLDFTEELIRQLGGIDLYSEPPVSRKCITFVSNSILPVYSNLRRNDKLCYQIHGKEQKTNVVYETCGGFLCFVKGRNCLKEFHER